MTTSTAAALADLIEAAEYFATRKDAWHRTNRDDDYLEMLRANLTLSKRYEALTGACMGADRKAILALAHSECSYDLEEECWLDDDGNLARSKPVYGYADYRADEAMEARSALRSTEGMA